jgi:acyl-CoA thioesterase
LSSAELLRCFNVIARSETTKQSILASLLLDCFAGARNDGKYEMLTTTPHLFDEATRVTAGDSCWQGRTSEDYWAFVGPFGGATAATILRALIDHPQRSGDPLSLTVNFCAPITQGDFDLDVRLVKANRSSQHWCVELMSGGEVATLATAVFAERRPSWSHQPAELPQATPFDQIRPFPKLKASWANQYDFRFVEGDPDFGGAKKKEVPASAFSKCWIGDRVPRKIDMLSLTAMSDAFFGRIFHARGELVPFGTVSLTTYFHADAADLAAEDISRVLTVADANVFHKSYGDQTAKLWSPGGRLLATTTQIAYFKA